MPNSRVGRWLFAGFLAVAGLVAIFAGLTAGGILRPLAGVSQLPASVIVSFIVGIGFLAIAVAAARTEPTREIPDSESGAHRDGHSPWRAATTSLVVALVATLMFIAISAWVIGSVGTDSTRLPMLIVVCLIALLAGIAFVVIALGIFGLKDQTQALGLPAGSVQAIIALSLILLFVALTAFLVTTINGTTSGPSVDLAKQVLTVLGTLVTAVSSFYFGSRSTSEAVRVARTPPPTPESAGGNAPDQPRGMLPPGTTPPATPAGGSGDGAQTSTGTTQAQPSGSGKPAGQEGATVSTPGSGTSEDVAETGGLPGASAEFLPPDQGADVPLEAYGPMPAESSTTLARGERGEESGASA